MTHYIPFLDAYQEALGQNEYYEQVLRVITMLDEPEIKAKRLEGQRWYKIDDIQDLDIAESIFALDEEQRVKLLQGRYGGYWRYPKLLDFCYLVNPYFPPGRMKDEIRANFDILLNQYPSGMGVNSLLAAKNFNVHQENILVGNGAAELIKRLIGRLEGKVGFTRPTFDEYPNRYERGNYVMKSISKSYGVPGLRLGVLASGDTEAIAAMKRDVAIWNINSFGEFYSLKMGFRPRNY